MLRLLTCALLCTFIFSNCSSNNKENNDDEPLEIPAEEEDIVVLDTNINPGLIEWAHFFDVFTKDMSDFDIIKEQMRFPFVSYEDTILDVEDLYLKDYEILLPKSFAQACEKANMEMGKELNHFETNKLFKFENSDQGLFQLLIEYNPENVTVTFFEHVPNTKAQFEHTTYTFKKIEGKYYLISITQ